ncbi:MAG: helix-turn-helix transcriptional regulator [Fimbriimonadaceae bacterium]|nr:helix-turn-helix transcriptional regulator [Fimbriimonadaceae bacterium]
MRAYSQKSHVLTAEQVRCLATPARNEVYQRLRAIQPASVADVAASLGRSVELVHYHARSLVKCGLIAEVEKRPSGRRPEAVYSAVHGPVQLPEPSPDTDDVVREMVVGGLRLTARQYERASIASASDPEIRNSMHVLRAIVRLNNDDFEEFTEMLERVGEFLKEKQSPEGKSITWSSAVYPNLPAKKSKARKVAE